MRLTSSSLLHPSRTSRKQRDYPSPHDEITKYQGLGLTCRLMTESGKVHEVPATFDLASREGTRGNYFILCPAKDLLAGPEEEVPVAVSFNCTGCEPFWSIEVSGQ